MSRISMRKGFSKKSIAAVSLVAAAAVTAAPASNAFAAEGDPGTTPAFVGPMLHLFSFGTTVGAPLICAIGTGAVLAGASEYGLGQAAAPVVDAVSNACDTITQQGYAYVQAFQEADNPLSVINQYVNGPLQQFADTVTKFGTDEGQSLAPFGPTIAGFGGTIAFFEGS